MGAPLPFEVYWNDHCNVRRFRTVKAAEKFARSKVVSGDRVEIYDECVQVATVRMDALDRVWTDVCASPGTEALL
jgi:hypothetical protein